MNTRYSIFIAAFLLATTTVNAQTTVTTGLPSSAGSLSGTNPGIVFIVSNTNSYPIVITDVACYRDPAQNGNTFYLKYSSTSLSGPATTTTWPTIATIIPSNITALGIHPTFTGLSFTIPGNTTYRLSMETNGTTMNYGAAATVPNSFSGGGLTIGTGNYTIGSLIVGYSGAGGNISLFSPRFWCGSITFSPGAANNLAGQAILQPANLNQYCSYTPINVKVLIKNSGSAPQSNFPVEAFYSNGGLVSGNLYGVYTGTLAPSASDSISLGTLTLQPGNYSLVAYTKLATDTLKSNDTTPTVNFTLLPAISTPQAFSDTVCAGGNASIYINPQPNTIYKWYSFPTGGSSINIGNGLNFTPLINDTLMYVSATVNGCESPRVPISAVIGPPPVVNLGNDTSFCESIPLILNAGNPNGKYLWSTGDSTQTISLTNISGKYWVRVDKYCVSSDSINITIDPLPFAAGISYVRTGNAYHFTATAPAFVNDYLWIFGDGFTSTLPNPTHTYGSGINADIMVRLVVSNQCGTDTVFRKVPTSIGEVNMTGKYLFLYPNPANEYFDIKMDGGLVKEVYMINSIGSIVLKESVSNSSMHRINVAHLPAGNYIVRVNSTKGAVNKSIVILRE